MRWIIILLGIPMGFGLVVLAIYLLVTGEASTMQGLGMAAMGVLLAGAGVNALSPSILARMWEWYAMRGSRSPFDTPEVDELVGLVERGERFHEVGPVVPRRVADTDVADPTALAFLIKVAIGVDPEAAEGYFHRACERDPGHHLAHELMLLALCQKWHGSHEAMFELARDAADAAPAGSSLPMLLVTAHLEHWLYAAHFDGQPALASAFLLEHREEVARACADSIDHRDHRPDRLTPWRLNEAACWAYLTQDHERLARWLRRLGDVQTRVPWAYVAPRAFRAARQLARSA